MTRKILRTIALAAAQLATEIVTNEKINKELESPLDLAVLCHKKRYVNCTLFNKMMNHLAAFGYYEQSGEVYTLAESWKTVLPRKEEIIEELKALDIHQLYYLLEFITKHYIEIVKNESNNISLSNIVYYLDAVDSSKGINEIRAETISSIPMKMTPYKIFDFNMGLGYSTIQLSQAYERSKLFALNVLPELHKASNYTIKRFQATNITLTDNYPAPLFKELLEEKVDLVTLLNLYNFAESNFDHLLSIANQISHEGTRLLLYNPLANNPLQSVIPDWIGSLVAGIDFYPSFETLRKILSSNGFRIESHQQETNTIVATFTENSE